MSEGSTGHTNAVESDSVSVAGHTIVMDSPLEISNVTNKNAAAQNERVDTRALNGLRGIMAIYIMVFHSLIYSELGVDILGTVMMTFFILISGFVLALNDGKHTYAPTKCCTELRGDPEDDTRFDGKNFYQRRMARTLPLFYFTNLMCIPLMFAGQAWIGTSLMEVIPTFTLMVFAASTWMGMPIVVNGPSWFVSTIWFYYWIFPNLLCRLQRYTTKQKYNWLIGNCVLQLLIPIAIASVGFALADFGLWIAYFWPVSRINQFIMGVLAGLLRNEGLGMRVGHSDWSVQRWSKCSNIFGALFVIFLVASSVITNVFAIEMNVTLWFQFAITWWSMEFIISLTFDEGSSVVSMLLRSKVALFLGRISYAVYLVHDPIRQYLCWAIYGAIDESDCDGDSSECEDDMGTIPGWAIPVMWIVTVVVAILLNRFFEEPLRKKLRPSRRCQVNTGGNVNSQKGSEELAIGAISQRTR